ncbi:MAG: hypothetical protein ACKO6N_05650 [Myxococcota bacterium]
MRQWFWIALCSWCLMVPHRSEAAEETGMVLLNPSLPAAQSFQRLKPQLSERGLSTTADTTPLKADSPMVELLRVVLLRERLREQLVEGKSCPERVPDFTPLIKTAYEDLLYLEYDRVLAALEQAPAALLCGEALLTPEVVNQYFLIQAAVQLRAKRSAEGALSQALLILPEQPLPTDLPQVLQAAFLTAKDAQLRQPPLQVRFQAPVSTRLKLWVNAKPVTDVQLSLRPGQHLLQWVYDKEVLVSRWVTLEGNKSTVWPPDELKLPETKPLLQALETLPEQVPPPELWRRVLQRVRIQQGWQWLALVGGKSSAPSVLLTSARGTVSLVLLQNKQSAPSLGLQPELGVGAAFSFKQSVRVTPVLHAGFFWSRARLEPGLRVGMGYFPLEVKTTIGHQTYLPLSASVWLRKSLPLGKVGILQPALGYGVSHGTPALLEGCLLRVENEQEVLDCQTSEGDAQVEYWHNTHGPLLELGLSRKLGPGLLSLGLSGELRLPLGGGPTQTEGGLPLLLPALAPELMARLLWGYGYAF